MWGQESPLGLLLTAARLLELLLTMLMRLVVHW